MLIKETYAITADDTDVLAAPSRLAAIPFNGVLTLEVSATVSNASNNAKLTIERPDGEVPVSDQLLPANGYDTSNDLINEETKMAFKFDASQGGHFRVALDVTGTIRVFVIATLSR